MTDTSAAPLGRPPNQLVFLVGEVSGKVDTLLASLPAYGQRLDALDVRVASIEVRMGRYAGGLLVIIFLIGAWELVRYILIQQ